MESIIERLNKVANIEEVEKTNFTSDDKCIGVCFLIIKNNDEDAFFRCCIMEASEGLHLEMDNDVKCVD